MAGNRKNIADTVWDLILPTVSEQGCSLWDVEYVKEGARQILRVTIDRAEGVDIDHCEAVHRAIDPILDEADPIPVAYYLEVSSPGVERELRTPVHVEACEGWNVEVKLYAPLNGAKLFRGVLLASAENGDIRIMAGEDTLTFPRETVAKINTYFEF
jgi:ribosome maturation factor RimP